MLDGNGKRRVSGQCPTRTSNGAPALQTGVRILSGARGSFPPQSIIADRVMAGRRRQSSKFYPQTHRPGSASRESAGEPLSRAC